ncbi:hypothetical protein [Pedobacter zeae]|uniref:Uncharacterized protein n=1 Tax=Pedobacter zeae TaxID=1737356 RepID=A0A7W6K9Q5_9SPHI|nr:hypothetical protein [Pedobacter zeae]MBB4106730.1 hypothetical protein [Pedobacter zeae]GGH03393.1 hypothetical protein GCM10007422_18430 [Pedobacter zeae]
MKKMAKSDFVKESIPNTRYNKNNYMKACSKWVKRIGLVALIILLLIAGFIFERVSRNDAEKITPDGNFAEVDNHLLHYYKKGNGGPTVVFETAFDPAGHLQ